MLLALFFFSRQLHRCSHTKEKSVRANFPKKGNKKYWKTSTEKKGKKRKPARVRERQCEYWILHFAEINFGGKWGEVTCAPILRERERLGKGGILCLVSLSRALLPPPPPFPPPPKDFWVRGEGNPLSRQWHWDSTTVFLQNYFIISLSNGARVSSIIFSKNILTKLANSIPRWCLFDTVRSTLLSSFLLVKNHSTGGEVGPEFYFEGNKMWGGVRSTQVCFSFPSPPRIPRGIYSANCIEEEKKMKPLREKKLFPQIISFPKLKSA